MPSRKIDLVGQRFDKLVVLKRVRGASNGQIWLCQCDCGNTFERRTYSIIKTMRNTGCVACKSKTLSQMQTKHGGSPRKNKPLLYGMWCSMRNRCASAKNQDYHLYGGKGIRVCPDWLDFGKFREWAIQAGYAIGLTIDRVNPNWHYDPSNCEWISPSENSRRAKLPGHYWRSMTCNA